MPQNLALEIRVIERFVQKRKQERFIHFVSSEKNRWKFILELYHFPFFKSKLMSSISSNEQAVIIEQLRRKALPDKYCYAISTDSSIDGETIDIPLAVAEAVGYSRGTILVFGDAEMIFYQGESLKAGWLSG